MRSIWWDMQWDVSMQGCVHSEGGPLGSPICAKFYCPQVSCCNGWKDNISSMGWWLTGTPCWCLHHSPCPKPLDITTTTAGQLPPTLHTIAASAAAPDKIC